MAGAGGVWLELYKDVAFAMPPVSADKVHDLIARTRIATLLSGYRGGPAYDVDALVEAIVALGAFAVDAGEHIESVDINPFVVMPGGQGAKGQGACALDALVILRPLQ